MQRLLPLSLLLTLASFQAFAQTHKKGSPPKRTASHTVTKPAVAPTPLTKAFIETKNALKDRIDEENGYMMALVSRTYGLQMDQVSAMKAMLDNLPTDKDNRDALLIGLARMSGGTQPMVMQLVSLGVSEASARMAADYTASLP